MTHIYQRILRDKWAFLSPLDSLPGEQRGERSTVKGAKYTWDESSRHNFIDNGGSILIVAHTDSVATGNFVRANHDTVRSPSLDNRIGVWLALCELPRRGVIADVLLTEGEETCSSTATHFVTDKQYNWIASFDRMGFDCALYQYKDATTERLVREHGYNPVLGSYSDICDMERFNVKAFNFGIGYRDYHSKNSHILIRELVQLIKMFMSFYDEHHNTHLPHERVERYYGRTQATKGKYRWYEDYDYRATTNYGGVESSGALYDDYKWMDDPVIKRGESKSWRVYVPADTDYRPKTKHECDCCQLEFDLHDLSYDSVSEMILCKGCYALIHTGFENVTPEKFIDESCDGCGDPIGNTRYYRVDGQLWRLCDECLAYYARTGRSIEIP